jgi:hypothetical protein
MGWCEVNHVAYIFGLARNSRFVEEIKGEMEEAQKLYEQTRRASRVYKDFFYRTLNSWTAGRRVIAKAEHIEKGANPRFIVTSLKSEDRDARRLYEQAYCARGERGNRIKEQQLPLFADRTSTGDDAGESTEAMVFVCGLYTPERIKTRSALLDRICKGAMQHNPHEAFEDWRTGQG